MLLECVCTGRGHGHERKLHMNSNSSERVGQVGVSRLGVQIESLINLVRIYKNGNV